MNKQITSLNKIFERWSGEKAVRISPLPPSGSYREYHRIIGKNKIAIGVFNADKKENIAFLTFTRHFFNKGLNVPEIYDEDLENNVYLIQDLGDTTLFSYSPPPTHPPPESEKRGIGETERRKTKQFTDSPIHLFSDSGRNSGRGEFRGADIYKKVIEELPRFQILAGKDLDYSVCYPRPDFDKQSMMWDLNYFKYYFLKLAKIPFDEQKLEDDFQCFSDYLLKTDCSYFLYRDFQSRNIMIHEDVPWFIDYQGGRRGALQYDVASLLFDARANIPQEIRAELLDHYISIITKIIPVDKMEFIQYFYGYAIIRIMQAMGAYGFRGLYEKKEHFLKSIPFAIKNIEWIINTVSIPVEMPTLMDVFKRLINTDLFIESEQPPLGRTMSSGHRASITGSRGAVKLKVTLNSFSYNKGIPVDHSDNGGGFVFDCRALHNPGRYDEYKHLTGKDIEVIKFFNKHNEVVGFLNNIYSLADQSIENHQERNFTNLVINFGCTGGQHRSVYCVEMLAKHINAKYNVDIIIKHIALENSK